MTPAEQKRAARAFVERWQAAEGSEEREARSFWIELCGEVLGIANPTHVLDFERKVRGRRIDVFYEDMGILIECKSRGVNLDGRYERGKLEGGEARMVTPYEQARWYADNIVPRSVAPRWILTCNFDEIRIYDANEEYPERSYETIRLEELPDLAHRLSFFTKKEGSRLERERELSIQAGEIVAKLYDELSSQYLNIDTDPREQRSLNVLIVRIVFLLYAEDAGLMGDKQAFYKYLQPLALEDMRGGLIQLFRTLDTPEEERDPYMKDSLKAFPYVNGGLFRDDIVVPQFDLDARVDLLQHASAGFDWSKISPTIFGAVFESTLNPETRRAGGMHYTSIENIHKLTGPLFYDELKDELTKIEGLKSERERGFKLRAFQEKVASLKFLDPACGSGNFLTETYLSLRKLENRVIEDLQGEQLSLGGDLDPVKVSIGQFYGIEVNDFAVSVAKTALWIAELQMAQQTSEIVQTWIEPFPLKSNEHILEGNALRMDWGDVLPASECDYVIGNPPFLGYSNLSAGQKEDRTGIFGKSGGTLDYVACWYRKAADYIDEAEHCSTRCAFVSTNSICQGQQVEPLWKPLFERGFHIDFAWRTFVWNNEATDQAHVHCVIVGFSKEDTGIRALYSADGTPQWASNINAYLAPAGDAFVTRRSKPLCSVREMVAGGKPTDGGNLLLAQEERDALVAKCPAAEKWVRPFSMGAEFINGKARYCLWLVGATPKELQEMPEVMERVSAVREFRLSSKKAATRKKADTPWLFDEVRPPKGESYIAVPKVSSGRRKYVPMGFVTDGMIPGDMLFSVSDAGLFEFGIMMSQFHNAWMRAVAGRLKSDYRYTNTIVYNNFVWPGPTESQRAEVERCAQGVLDARALYPDSTLADMYDPDNGFLYPELVKAHRELDVAVEAAYGVDFGGDEEKIVAHLFELYAELTSAG